MKKSTFEQIGGTYTVKSDKKQPNVLLHCSRRERLLKEFFLLWEQSDSYTSLLFALPGILHQIPRIAD